MKEKSKAILKFLFPEYKIIEAIKQRGFISKAKESDNMSYEKVHNTSSFQYETDVNIKVNMEPKFEEKHSNMNFNDNMANQNQKAKENRNNDYKKYYSNNFAKGSLDENMNNVRVSLGNKFIGQSDYLDSLCIAFKRAFLTGTDGKKAKNVIFVVGNKGTGKHSSVSELSKLCRNNNLINFDNVMPIDLSVYDESDEKDDFLSHLYWRLNGQFDIISFDNFDKCHHNILDVLIKLSTKGEYDLNSRYTLMNNNLVESPSAPLDKSIGSIDCNGKIFVFYTDKSEKQILELCGTEFIRAIGDIVYTGEFSERELREITKVRLSGYRDKCNKNLDIRLRYSEDVVADIASKFKVVDGINGLDEYIEENIYKGLAEAKLRGKIANAKEMVDLTYENEAIIVNVSKNKYCLNDFINNRYNSGLDEVKNELKNVIGLHSVKKYVENIEDNLKIQKKRKDSGYKVADVSMHMIFTGNPGTGKTTIARIVAKYLKVLGALSTGQLIEVTRADLVAQYVGHTAKLTNDVIKSALGGVLFIDEAYSLCRDEHDSFGKEAIDALVKGIEDNRNNLVVILAGYKDEMNDFLKTNSGLKSRFPNIIDFEDYTAKEMYEISLVTAKSKGYTISDECGEALVELYEKKQIKGKNDSGNGRLVRNIIEQAILNQSQRLLKDDNAHMDILTYEDFAFEDNSKFDLEANLAEIIGLEEVKDFVRTQHKLLIAQQKRKNAGMKVNTTQALNMIFSGNPGTGKTTVARVVAKMFKEMGLLKSGHLIETDRGGLVAEYVGQTAKKTEEVFKSALGGVLFIDEAYALSSDGSSFGKEAIDTLVKLIEDYRGEIVVILAGYKKEMVDFLKANSGLQSRFPLSIDFPDYDEEELYNIALKMLESNGFILEHGADGVLKEKINLLKKTSNSQSGNGRMIRNYLEEIMRNQSARIAMEEIAAEDMNVITFKDIEPVKNEITKFNLEEELEKIIGIDEVKDFIRSLNARLRVQNERKRLGLPIDDGQTLHMIFKGNPGTGKTTIARVIAKTLYNIGVISTDKLIETDRAGLVAGYVGQTAIKTTEKFMEAMDGVLFIDEAYALSQGGANDFGKEAIDTLVKLMDDYRERVIVILAGYSSDMNHFLSINSGLKSRFPNIIEFKDYNAEQLMDIAEKFFKGKGYEVDSTAKEKMRGIFESIQGDSQFGNGRYVRNLFEKALNNQAMRLSSYNELTKKDLIYIIDEDIERV